MIQIKKAKNILKTYKIIYIKIFYYIVYFYK